MASGSVQQALDQAAEIVKLKKIIRHEYRRHQEMADNPQDHGICNCRFCQDATLVLR